MKKLPKAESRQSGARHSAARHPRRITDVAAALIFREGKILITRRHSDVHLGGLWEFPGGKREAGETFEQCLAREIREELGVGISIGELFEEVTHTYPEKTVRLKFFVCELVQGQPQALGCAAVKWIGKSELPSHEFPAADVRLLEKLEQHDCSWVEGLSWRA